MEQDQEGHVEPAAGNINLGEPKKAALTSKERTKLLETKAFLKSQGMCTEELDQRLSAAEPKKCQDWVLAKSTTVGLQKHMQRMDKLDAQELSIVKLVEEEAKAHAKIKNMLEQETAKHEAIMEAMRTQGDAFIQTAVTKLKVAREEHAVEKTLCEEEAQKWAAITKDTAAEAPTIAKAQTTVHPNEEPAHGVMAPDTCNEAAMTKFVKENLQLILSLAASLQTKVEEVPTMSTLPKNKTEQEGKTAEEGTLMVIGEQEKREREETAGEEPEPKKIR
jgi:hypothetical protein